MDRQIRSSRLGCVRELAQPAENLSQHQVYRGPLVEAAETVGKMRRMPLVIYGMRLGQLYVVVENLALSAPSLTFPHLPPRPAHLGSATLRPRRARCSGLSGVRTPGRLMAVSSTWGQHGRAEDEGDDREKPRSKKKSKHTSSVS